MSTLPPEPKDVVSTMDKAVRTEGLLAPSEVMVLVSALEFIFSEMETREQTLRNQ